MKKMKRIKRIKRMKRMKIMKRMNRMNRIKRIVKIWKVIFVFQPLEVLNTTGNEQVQRAKQALLFSLRCHMIGNAQGPCGPE